MPFDNRVELEQRLNTYDQQLVALFNQIEENIELKQNLERVKEYYRLSFSRATEKSSADSIVASYEIFVGNLTKVRDGTLTTKDALAIVKETTDSREMGIIFHNVGTVLELMFWALATVSCYMAATTVGAPLLLVQPLLGIAIILGASALILATTSACGECFGEFKSLDRLRDEDKRERDLVSFFKPAEPVAPPAPRAEESRSERLYPDLSAATSS